MAKTKRRVVGSVLKSQKNEKEKYIKIRDDLVLKKGDTLRLESKKEQLESLEKAIATGKLSAEMGDTIRDRVNRIPDFVIAEIIQLKQE